MSSFLNKISPLKLNNIKFEIYLKLENIDLTNNNATYQL